MKRSQLTLQYNVYVQFNETAHNPPTLVDEEYGVCEISPEIVTKVQFSSKGGFDLGLSKVIRETVDTIMTLLYTYSDEFSRARFLSLNDRKVLRKYLKISKNLSDCTPALCIDFTIYRETPEKSKFWRLFRKYRTYLYGRRYAELHPKKSLHSSVVRVG